MQTLVRHGWPLQLLVLGLAMACGGSSWNSTVREANDSQKVLIIEFYADWCAPCAWFETNVLSDAEVRAALEQVEFRRYDYDSSKGREHANRLGVRAIPSVVAVGRNGDGFRTLRGAVSKSTFIQFLRSSRAHVYPEAEPSTSSRPGGGDLESAPPLVALPEKRPLRR